MRSQDSRPFLGHDAAHEEDGRPEPLEDSMMKMKSFRCRFSALKDLVDLKTSSFGAV